MRKQLTKDGFTLIEIIIAIFIIAVALTSVMAVTTMIINSNALSKEITMATTIAQSRMEQLKKTPYASLAGGSETQSIYTTRWTVTSNSPMANMSTAQVVTTWKHGATTHNSTLRTIIAK